MSGTHNPAGSSLLNYEEKYSSGITKKNQDYERHILRILDPIPEAIDRR